MAVTGEPHLLSIWGSSSRDVFVVGDKGVILHYDGQAWTPMASGTTKNLISVWGTSSRDVFAAGYGGTVLHYDGARWTPMETGTTGDLYGIWGTAPDSVMAVGGSPMPLPGKGLVLRYDGKAWSPMTIPDSPFLAGVWGSSMSDVFAVGVNLAILHFDGKAWTAMPANVSVAPGQAEPAVPGVGHRARRRLCIRVRRGPAALRRPVVVIDAVGHNGEHGCLRRRARGLHSGRRRNDPALRAATATAGSSWTPPVEEISTG